MEIGVAREPITQKRIEVEKPELLKPKRESSREVFVDAADLEEHLRLHPIGTTTPSALRIESPAEPAHGSNPGAITAAVTPNPPPSCTPVVRI